jgi:hypothetical protein
MVITINYVVPFSDPVNILDRDLFDIGNIDY